MEGETDKYSFLLKYVNNIQNTYTQQRYCTTKINLYISNMFKILIYEHS